jgi:pyruvate kinase
VKLAINKTKLVCTIGPASDSPGVMLQMLRGGMDIARLNYSHGDFAKHWLEVIDLSRGGQ